MKPVHSRQRWTAHDLRLLRELYRDNPMEPDRARAVAQVATVLVDSAKVEVDYLRATGQQKAGFLEEPAVITVDTQPNGAALPNGITSVTRHTLQG